MGNASSAEPTVFLDPEEWIPDADRPNCVLCKSAFSLFLNPRHHCRLCGEVVCTSCSSVVCTPWNPTTPVRFCMICAVSLLTNHEGNVVFSNDQGFVSGRSLSEHVPSPKAPAPLLIRSDSLPPEPPLVSDDSKSSALLASSPTREEGGDGVLLQTSTIPIDSPTYECWVCLVSHSRFVPHFECDRSEEKSGEKHRMCARCFGDFVLNACGLLDSNLPLKCNYPDCHDDRDLGIIDLTIHKLLNQPSNAVRDLWNKYTDAQVHAGLVADPDMTPVTCPRCEQNTFLLPRDYRIQAIHLSLDIEAYKKKQMERETKKRRQHVESLIKTAVPNTNTWFSRLASWFHTPVDDSEGKTVVPTNTTTGVNEDEDDTIPPFIFEAKTKSNALTGLYVECTCGGCLCLRCDAMIDAIQVETHSCANEMKELYDELSECLVNASVQRCPGCNMPGQKDLACTHMFCAGCKTSWCYCCGEAVFSNFSAHNNIMTAPNSDIIKCPMYLPARYWVKTKGSNSSHEKKALQYFHFFKQLEAKDKFDVKVKARGDTYQVLLLKMYEEYFPRGVFPESTVQNCALMKIRDDNLYWTPSEDPYVYSGKKRKKKKNKKYNKSL